MAAAPKARPPSAIWRARFSLDVEPAGPVHALVSLIGDKTAVRMWAERPATAAQLRAGADPAQPGPAPGRAQPRRYPDRRRRAAAGPAGARRPLPGPRDMSVETKSSSRSRCITTGAAPRASSPRARAPSAKRSSRWRRPTTSRSRKTRCLAGALSHVELGDEIPAGALQGGGGSADFRAAAVGQNPLGTGSMVRDGDARLLAMSVQDLILSAMCISKCDRTMARRQLPPPLFKTTSVPP